MRHANSAQTYPTSAWAVVPVGVYCAGLFVFEFVAWILAPLAPYQFGIGMAIFAGLMICAGVFVARNIRMCARALAFSVVGFALMLAAVEL